MENINPVVITSKPAQEHFNKIKAEHSDMITGIQNQETRVQQYNMQKEQEKQMLDQQNKTFEADNQKAMADIQTKKMEAENKKRELDIKEQALSL